MIQLSFFHPVCDIALISFVAPRTNCTRHAIFDLSISYSIGKKGGKTGTDSLPGEPETIRRAGVGEGDDGSSSGCKIGIEKATRIVDPFTIDRHSVTAIPDPE